MSGFLNLTYPARNDANVVRQIMLDFPAGDPVFAGHYPGFPVIPASLVVDLCCELLHDQGWITVPGPEGWFLKHARFQAGIRPGDNVTLTVAKDGCDCTVHLRTKAQEIATLRFSRNASACTVAVAEAGPVTLGPASCCLPQRYPMMAVDQIGISADAMTGAARKNLSYGDYAFRNFTPEAAGGAEPAYPLGGVIEGIEQAAAALLARHWDFADPSQVVLIGELRGVHIRASAHPGEVISFVTRIELLADNLATLSGQAHSDERLLVSIDKIVVVRLENPA